MGLGLGIGAKFSDITGKIDFRDVLNFIQPVRLQTNGTDMLPS